MVAGLMALHSCKIENDIPYPIVEGNIESFEVEGQCAAPDGSGSSAAISSSNRTVTLYVDDTVDLTNLRITRFTVSSEAKILADAEVCTDAAKFPTAGFETLDNTADTRVNFTNPVRFTLQTYQDYVWTVNVTQIIERNIDVVGQIRSVVDTENRVAIVYVSMEQDLSDIQVNAMNLGGASGKVTPDPTKIRDFSSPQKFQVSQGWEETSKEWTVYVYRTEEDASSAGVFPRTTSATLTGTIQSGKTPVVEYKEASASSWTTASDMEVNGTKYTAEMIRLKANTPYNYRVSVDGVAGAEQSFTTAPATPLTNGGLEDWSNTTVGAGKILWNPWGSGADSFWDTGNRGATIVSNSNSVRTEETCNSSSSWAASLSSVGVPIQNIAAGNLFTGDFDLEGMNGILTLGREFSAFPTSLRFHCKYTTSRITQSIDRLSDMRGQNDTCHVYIALSTEKVILRTSQEDVFNKRGSSIVAYGEFCSGVDVSGSERNGYTQIDVPLEYYKTNVTPQYLIIVCSSSKYGNLFTGGVESVLYLDEMELIYE